MSWEEIAKIALDRWVNIAVNVTLCVLFAATMFVTETWWGAVMMAWASGAQFGFAAMWFIGPSITAKWRREMEAEIAIMTAAVFARIMRESNIHVEVGPPTSPPIAPGLH